ncbi:phosphatidate cytidylyltransferase [Thorsellia anophelis]|uniref:Phosphatidate cytidylyltransferase n=1 Tax=Thorsellia anophelis DSM 18579 TaxID=1123402 RepID=A0A1H9Z7X5_9GAMM|nr:phosphatidate cytidylyltransferase [Thorsellia anophelis]SES77438.1 phosphatidate cytidylyltransferase [Thorsellia anophelis DSM 18579]
MIFEDEKIRFLLLGLAVFLTIASMIGFALSKKVKSESQIATVKNLNARIIAWWVMCWVCVFAMAFHTLGTVLLFTVISFFALRECITLIPTRRGDHEVLFWCFFILLPIQYILIGLGWNALFTVFIPVSAFILIPTRIAIAGDAEHFMERTAKIQWGVMVAVYLISYVPALLLLDIENFQQNNISLILFLLIVVQLSDVLQYIFGKLFGKHKIAPLISPNKTVEGFIGGILSAIVIAMTLSWLTPFNWWQTGMIAFVLTLAGFMGGLCMSAIKRDQGVKDFGVLIKGHGGMMDRIDSLCFSAPLFFHIIYYFA